MHLLHWNTHIVQKYLCKNQQIGKDIVKTDELDQNILQMLQEDGRASNVEIGRKLSVPHTRVRDRILRMEEAGIIEGYSVRVNPLILGYNIHALVQVEVDQQQEFDVFAEQLMQMDEVVEVANVTGEFDAIVRIWVRDVTHLRHFLYNEISTLPAHKRTVSSIILKRFDKPLGTA